MSLATEQIRRYCDDADQGAFGAFYRAQAPRLWKFLIARGCDTEAAYDLLAEAFLRFTQAVCRDPHAPVAFLYRIAINLRVDSHRREKAAAVDAIPDVEQLQLVAPEEPDDFREVRILVAGLPESEQNLLLLRYWIGLSHKEVAQAVGLPEGTVRRRCADIIKTLGEEWARRDRDAAR